MAFAISPGFPNRRKGSGPEETLAGVHHQNVELAEGFRDGLGERGLESDAARPPSNQSTLSL